MKCIFVILAVICSSYTIMHSQRIMDVNVVGNAILIPENIINTPSFEFSPVFYGPYVGFVNDRGKAENYDKTYDTPFFDLSFAGADTEGNLAKQATFVSDISSEFQEGPFCLSPDQSTMYFTRTDPKLGLLKIYYAIREDGEWKFQGKLNIDFLGHLCHPTISEDGLNLIFAGTLPGDPSGMDLYTANLYDDRWTDIKKLPDGINSPSNDWFPRYIGDSIIVFASQREGGFGGLDMYVSKKVNEAWSPPELIGKPVNSVADDFGLIVGNEIAYFSSNRLGGKGKDDLYRIEFKGNLIYDPGQQKSTIAISILNKLTFRRIPNAVVKLVPVKEGEDNPEKPYFDIDYATSKGQEHLVAKIIPDPTLPKLSYQVEEGIVYPEILESKQYVLQITAPGYSSYNALYSFAKDGESPTYVLEPNSDEDNEGETGLIIPTSKGSIVIFENIYYDFNSYNIQAGAAAELDALVEVMKENPDLSIQLAAHTDARGSKTYNQKLSERRAISARNYLINKGVSPQRIVAIGYGESQLRNHCLDKVKCSEEEHQFNRRTEVKILDN